MPIPILFVEPRLAQTPVRKTLSVKPTVSVPPPIEENETSQVGLYAVSALLLLIILGVLSHLKVKQLEKQIRVESLKNRELQKRLKLAVESISKMEKNPDLIHSREFNLDYLRMRMAEENFNFAIVNQIKVSVKEKVSLALRPSQSNHGAVGIASTGRQVDEIFDVEYEPGGDHPQGSRRVLFRIQIKMMKIPTQPTSETVRQIIDCLEIYLSPADEEHDTWQPVIQGRIAQISWDQKAKPTPLLVLEQTNEGSNVTFRTARAIAKR